MSHANKLRKMEVICGNLSVSESRLESPAWHAKALQDAQQLLKKGKARFSEWELAKRRLGRMAAAITGRAQP